MIKSLVQILRRLKLRGFETGKHAGRLIMTLFADDTMVYLSKLDRLKELKKILNKWCLSFPMENYAQWVQSKLILVEYSSDGKGRDKQGASRFSRMIILEASCTIWKIWCEWWISREADSKRQLNEVEIKNTPRRAIAQWMRLDCLATDKSCFGRKAKSVERVKNMWKNFLPKRVDPAKAWRKATEVLVGIG
ncbi:hypothetical protein J132_05568 [Termitomyces sp. J132]|nr:hypothetical protein J132_05568 [Termitomyces sp. J132]